METAFQKFTRIINWWIGKNADYDKQYGSQCVDFARQYASDAGYPIWTFSGSAFNWWKTGSPFDKSWKRVVKTSLNYPNPWDIVFFEPTRTNPYWHVAISDKWCSATLLCIIEQNAGSGNWDGKWANAIKRTNTTYNGSRWVCPWWFTKI